MTQILPLATRRSRWLFDWSAASCLAASEQSLNAITGQAATFTRASTKAALDANGVVRTIAHSLPAFQWSTDPVTGLMRPGVLMEDTRTSLTTFPEDFTNAAWTKAGYTVVANSVAGPNYAVTADTVVETATNAEHFVEQSTTGVADNTTLAWSVYVKAGRSEVKLSFVKKDNVTVIGAVFNLATGAVTSTDGGITTRIRAGVNGWYRITVIGSVGAGATQPRGRLQTLLAGAAVYLGDVGFGLYVVGGQIEVGAFESSYNAAAAVRNADVLSFAFNALPQALTLYIRGINRGSAQLNGGVDNPYYLLIGTAPNYLILYEGVGVPKVSFVNGTTVTATSAGANPAMGDTVELLATVSAAGVVDIGQSLNGATATGSTGASTGLAFPSAWSGLTINLGSGDVGKAFFEFQSAKVAAGVQTLATMRQG